MRTAPATKTAASASPIHSPGVPRNRSGVNPVVGVNGTLSGAAGTENARGYQPISRCLTHAPTCVVSIVSFSSRPSASSGSTAHSAAVRRAHPEIPENAAENARRRADRARHNALVVERNAERRARTRLEIAPAAGATS